MSELPSVALTQQFLRLREEYDSQRLVVKPKNRFGDRIPNGGSCPIVPDQCGRRHRMESSMTSTATRTLIHGLHDEARVPLDLGEHARRVRRAAVTLLVAAAAFLSVPEADAQETSLNTTCPTNVRAEAGARLATLGWSCDDAEVTGYEYRVKSPGEGWTGWLDAGGADASSFSVSGLAAGVEYTFQMRARGVKDVVTVETSRARRQFVTTMSPGPYARSLRQTSNKVIAMPFKTGAARHGYLITGARVKFQDFRRDADTSNDASNDTATTVVKLRTNNDDGSPQDTSDDEPGNQVLATFTLLGDGPMIDMREFRLPGGRELSPNTIYWLTVNEGVHCRAPQQDPTRCDRAYVSKALPGDKHSRYGWGAALLRRRPKGLCASGTARAT